VNQPSFEPVKLERCSIAHFEAPREAIINILSKYYHLDVWSTGSLVIM
jgi:hypothetical protein